VQLERQLACYALEERGVVVGHHAGGVLAEAAHKLKHQP
jgi:hypothetical protein